MKSKEMKLIIRNESDPEIYKWVTSLKYGTFPKLVLEILRWYERNGLLVRGGVNQPDLLPPKIPLNEVSLDTETLNEILRLAKENNQVLKSGEFIPPTENKTKSEHLEPIKPQLEAAQITVSDEETFDVAETEVESETDNSPMPNVPMPFKIYR